MEATPMKIDPPAEKTEGTEADAILTEQQREAFEKLLKAFGGDKDRLFRFAEKMWNREAFDALLKVFGCDKALLLHFYEEFWKWEP